MSKRLKLSEVDRLIDVLDRSRSDRGPRAEIETLQRAYVKALGADEIMRGVYGFAFIALTVALLFGAYASGSFEFPDWFDFVVLPLIGIQLLASMLLNFLFPILLRRERVGYLLEYFGVDVAEIDGVYARKNMPASVLLAVETLERAQSPAELGPAYSVVERWSSKAHGLNLDGVYLGFLCTVALILAISGDQFGLPDFWRGAAAAFIAIMAYQQITRSNEERNSRRRAEDALGRWRHLVPRMRELPQ